MTSNRYIASGRPRSSYSLARIMGFSKREAKKLVRWSRALVAKVMREELGR